MWPSVQNKAGGYPQVLNTGLVVRLVGRGIIILSLTAIGGIIDNLLT